MRTLILSIYGLLMAVSASGVVMDRDGRFDSAEANGFDGVVDRAYVITSQDTEAGQRSAIETQLFYMVGLLNTHQAAADLGHAKVVVTATEKLPGSDLFRVEYSLKLLVAWPRKSPPPAGFGIVLPARVDEQGLAEFFNKYHKDCSEDPKDPDLNTESFYYYFRPFNEGCALMNPEAVEGMRAAFALKVSAENSEGKTPEYGKIWEDGKLVVTMIYGTNHQGASSDKDAGITSYNNTYLSLRSFFGNPRSMRPQLGPKARPGKRSPDVEMEWLLSDGRVVNANILLIDKMALQDPTAEFAARYNQRTVASDYVSYNGHSGFGENIRSLAKMGTFLKGQYQLYFVNGCDTFFYVDDSLRAAHANANPGSTPYEFFDIITNAMPSPFAAQARDNMLMVRSMLEKKKTYREIMAGFAAPGQIAIVTGEEDNKWSQPF